MKKNILLVLTRPPYPAVDGTRERILGEIKDLSNDFKVNLLIVSDESVNVTSRKYLKNSIDGELFIFKLSKPLSYFRSLLSMVSGKPMQSSYFKQSRAMEWLENNYSKYETIHFHTIRFGEYIKKLKNNHSVLETKLLLCFNDSISLNYKDAQNKAKGLWKIIYFIESRRIKNYELELAAISDGLSIVSSRDMKQIQDNWIEKKIDLPVPKIQIIRHGIEDELFNYNYKQETDNLVFIGNLLYPPNKQGLDFFYKNIFTKIIKEKPDTKLLIIGRGGKEFFGNLDQVETYGFLEDPYLLMTTQSAFISPADFGAGVPTKSLLAMALGLPVISTLNNAAGIEGIIDGKNICLINYSECQYSAKKIIELLESKNRRENIGKDGKELVFEKYRKSINYPELKKFIDN